MNSRQRTVTSGSVHGVAQISTSGIRYGGLTGWGHQATAASGEPFHEARAGDGGRRACEDGGARRQAVELDEQRSLHVRIFLDALLDVRDAAQRGVETIDGLDAALDRGRVLDEAAACRSSRLRRIMGRARFPCRSGIGVVQADRMAGTREHDGPRTPDISRAHAGDGFQGFRHGSPCLKFDLAAPAAGPAACLCDALGTRYHTCL